MARNYKEEIERLKEIAHKDGRRVKLNWRNPEWRGMNPHAARELAQRGEYDGHVHTNTLCVSSGERSNKKRAETLRHEIIEDRLMAKGLKYKTAHKKANHLQGSLKALGG
jgi:hypothetical protein